MADAVYELVNDLRLKLHDNGDGSYSLVTYGGGDASLSVLDDWDESDRAKVNPIVGQAGVEGGSGAVSAKTIRTVLATDVGLPAGENHIGKIGGQKTYAKASFARPGDATPYSAYDAIADSTGSPTPTVMIFANMGRAVSQYGYIVGASVIHEKVTVTPRIRLHLWNAAPTPINDNAAFALTYAIVTNDNYMGFIEFPSMSSESGTDYSRAQRKDQGKLLEFVCSASNTSLYGMAETLDAFTPGNAKGFTFKLWGEVD